MSAGKPRIAMVTGGLPFGGSTTFLLYLASGLQSLDIPAEVFSFSKENAFAADFKAAKIAVHLSDEKKLIFEDRLTTLYKKIVEFRPTAVIANLGLESFEMLRYMPEGIKRLGMIHDPVNQKMLSIYKGCLDAIVVVNPTWVEVSRGFAPQVPCTFLAHGIPLPEPGLKRLPNPNEPLKLIYFGRFTEVKGADIFPEIAKHLDAGGIPYHWAMYGNGPSEHFLREKLAGQIKSGKVAIYPPISRHELYEKIRRHDIFMMAPQYEGGPLTLLEGMAVGLVPVCSDTPCLTQEVVNPSNGFCIPREPAHFLESLAMLHRDRALLERMSVAARKTITASYSTNAMAERYAGYINKIAPTSGRGTWQKNIKPQPMLGADGLSRLMQRHGIGRHARRVIKRIRS